MNGKDLEKQLLKDTQIRKYYGGIFCSDAVPNLEPRKIYIILTSTSSENYGHWFVIHTMKDPQQHAVEVLCSAQTSFKEYPHVRAVVEKYAETKVYSYPNRIQTKWSSSCASFCCLFAFFVARGIYGAEIYDRLYARYVKDRQLFKSEILTAESVQHLFHLHRGVAQDLILDLEFLEKQMHHDSS